MEILSNLHIRYHGYGWILFSGVANVVMGISFVGFLLYVPRAEGHFSEIDLIVLAASAVMILVGLGLILQKKWAYYPFKLGVYVNLLNFPIGTIISVFLLDYIKKNEIKNYMS